MRAAALAAVALLAAAPGHCGTRQLAAVVVYTAGDVRTSSPGSGPRPAKVSDNLYVGDALETGADGQASVALIYGAELRVNSLSSLEFRPGAKSGFVKLGAGQVWTRLLHKKARLEIRTPAAICGIRGTEADVEQREVLTVKVYEGHVDVLNGYGKVSLGAGQVTKVAWPAWVPLKPVKIRRGQEGAWQRNVTSPEVMRLFEKLTRDAAQEKELDITVGLRGGSDKKLTIKLRRK